MYEASQKHFGKDDSPVLFWKATTLQMNPSLDPKIVSDAYERDPIAARSEYDAEFRSDCETCFSQESVNACVIKGRLELSREKEVSYYGFVDPSGGSSDSMTLAIAHKNSTGRATLDLLREVKPPFSPERVVREFAQALSSYGLSTVTGDNYAGSWPKERFSVYGISYQPSKKTRSEIYLDLLPLLNSKRSELLDNQRLISQLTQLERHASRSGTETIDHAPGGHDDLANAAAGSLVMAAASSSNSGWGFIVSCGGTR
jgi:hypothetical protein